MADVFDKAMRTKVMSKVRQKDTPQEMAVRKFLFSKGLRFRKNYKKLPGSPDIVLPKYKTAIFVHGCFWHRHNCKYATLPKSNVDFWQNKFCNNIKRDKRNIRDLKKLGYRVIILWQCNLSNPKRKSKILEQLQKKIVQ